MKTLLNTQRNVDQKNILYLLTDGLNASPLNNISGLSGASSFTFVTNLAAPPTGSASLCSMLYTSLKCSIVTTCGVVVEPIVADGCGSGAQRFSSCSSTHFSGNTTDKLLPLQM